VFLCSELDEPCEVECIIKNHKNGEYSVFYNMQRTGLIVLVCSPISGILTHFFKGDGISPLIDFWFGVLTHDKKKKGLYKTHVTNEGTPILGSPFDTLIEPGLVDPSQCTAAGKVAQSCACMFVREIDWVIRLKIRALWILLRDRLSAFR
jgi:hypothetical protein